MGMRRTAARCARIAIIATACAFVWAAMSESARCSR